MPYTKSLSAALGKLQNNSCYINKPVSFVYGLMFNVGKQINLQRAVQSSLSGQGMHSQRFLEISQSGLHKGERSAKKFR
jgi:hypothetical protein